MPESEANPPARPKYQKKKISRAKLLEAAFKVFVERGYEGASLDRVAEAAGFSKGAVYSNFASKDELFFELVAARIDRAIEAVREATQRQGARQGKVRDASDTQAIGRELRKVLDEDDEAWQMLILEFLLRCNRNESLKAKFLERRRAMRSKIADLNLALAKVSGIEMSRTESMNLATAVLALSNGLGIERIIDEDAVPSRLFGELLSRITFKR